MYLVGYDFKIYFYKGNTNLTNSLSQRLDYKESKGL